MTLAPARPAPTPVGSLAAMEQLYEARDVFASGSFGVVRKIQRRTDGMTFCRKELNFGRMNDTDLAQLTAEVYAKVFIAADASSNILESMPAHDHIVRYVGAFRSTLGT